MGQILHKNATTTARIRKEIQNSKESGYKLAAKYGINIKTVYKWRKRKTVEDSKSGVSGAKKSNLTMREQQIICAVRKLTWLSLDDLLPVLKPVIPSLSRSALHLVSHEMEFLKCQSKNPFEKNSKTIRRDFYISILQS